MFKSKINMKLFPIYKMFSWDLLFYYAISFLFLTQVKDFSPAQVLSADSFYILFKLLVLFICIPLIDKLGKKNCLIFGNILVALSVYIIIIANSFSHILISFFVMALGYQFKELCESSLLYSSIPMCEKKRNIFAKIDAKGSSLYYFTDGITSIIASFSYVVNPYLPMYLCIACLLFSTFISFGFEDENTSTKTENADDEEYTTQTLKEYMQDIKDSFKFIFKSRRLRALFIFSVLLYSMFSISSTLRSSLFVDLGIPAQYFGVIIAVYQTIASISSRKQQWFHNRFRNTVLAFFSISMCLLFISVGTISIIGGASCVFVVLILYLIHYIVKGPYYTLMDKYLNSFSTREISTKIYSAKSVVTSIFSTLILQVASLVMDNFTTAESFVIIGFGFLIAFIFTLQYMKTRVGLKPEEYKKSDIEYMKVK